MPGNIKVISRPPKLERKKRVAAYARVSSGKDAMLHSLSAQVDYYSEYIGQRPEWEYAGVFADEALTGTKDSRPEFQRMLTECRAGNIQIIITKSISRFARNTLTVLQTVRELKALGVDVFFEEQNIHTMSGDGELMLTILASYAQEESRSASENQKWRIRKNFSEGKTYNLHMLGYRAVNGVLEIIPEEAEIVKAIFADYLSGMGTESIVNKYSALGVSISTSGLYRMLRNEKYQGNLLLQKRFRDNHITKRDTINIGQLPKYSVIDAHEPIIDSETFAAVQTELARRAEIYAPRAKPQESYAFSGLIKCGKCGAAFRRKYNNAGTKYEKAVWICDTYNSKGKSACASKQIPEDILLAKVAEVSGAKNIAEILAPEHNRLIITLRDGRRVDTEWQSPSRRESWTPEMREAARRRRIINIRGE